MPQEIRDGDGNIQIFGNNNVVHKSLDTQPSPDNPNLIICPDCRKYSVSRDADECPLCKHSFLKARLAAAEEARRLRKYGLIILIGLAVSYLLVTVQISNSKFHKDVLSDLGLGLVIFFLICCAGFWLWETIKNWNKNE